MFSSPDLFSTVDPFVDEDLYERIEGEIKDEIQAQKEEILIYLINETLIENITISNDGKWATAWLTPIDPDTGQTIPAEPGLVIAHYDGTEWDIALPSDPIWDSFIEKVPQDLLPEDLKIFWIEKSVARVESALGIGPFDGYYLPFAGGETLFMTQSINHDAYTPSKAAHYAFDFARGGYPSAMFNVHAAKGGRVYKAAWSYENGNPMYTNLLVLEDTTTEPTTYQLYMHLAQDSIPIEFREKGAYVGQGQFIGVADDTGVSSGNHLHFHVHTNPASYWGHSVDITFEDVLINGGRPRNKGDLKYCLNDAVYQDVCDETSYTYTSRNFPNPDYILPNGDITSPAYGATVTSNNLEIEGWANDEGTGIKSVQIIAKHSGQWQSISEVMTTTQFTKVWDLCKNQVPDGPVSLALEIQDNYFNQAEGLPGFTNFLKDFSCPPQSLPCQPSKDEIALFSETDFVGECVMLGIGDHKTSESLGNVGENNTESVLVGSDVMPTLFMNQDLSGRGDTILTNDSNLSNDRIGANTVSSVKVQSRQSTPRIPNLITPNYSAVYDQDETLSFSLDNLGGGTEFQFRININQNENLDSQWLKNPYWNFNGLPPGNYTWQARSKNENAVSGWSSFRYFYIQAVDSNANVFTAPYTDDMESTSSLWTNSGYWRTTNKYNFTQNGTSSWIYNIDSTGDYDPGSPNSGHLTSPPIKIPSSDNYYMRFWYKYDTESDNTNWDQRTVQISEDGGPFEDILLLNDDNPNTWLRSPIFSLADYSGKTVQIRFYFTTLDEVFNSFEGWIVDDFSITNTPPPYCSDSDNDPLNAAAIKYGESKDGKICPTADIDYYKFSGKSGDQIGVDITGNIEDTSQYPTIYLLDGDGESILKTNQNLESSSGNNPNLFYKLNRDGMYFLKVKSWNHPTNGGIDDTYTINIIQDSEKPDIKFIVPNSNQQISTGPITLTVDASDTISGISHVKFFWHPADWKDSDWISLGEDWDGLDGWKMNLDVPVFEDPSQIAFYARAYDRAGNVSGAAYWNNQGTTIFLP